MARGTRHLTTFALMAALGVFAAVGCGGSSVARDDSGGNDAGQASGGVEADGGTGGSPTTGGSPSNGGVPATGGVGAVSGTAGAAGEPSFCSLPAETGECRGYMERYAFDPTTGLCRPFVYGGCGGNANNFETAQSCYAACGASSERDPARCESPLDCTLMHSLCCGACEPPNLMNRVAVRTDQVAAVNQAMSCDCDPCGAADENPWLGATCSEGRCVSFDARTTKLVSCEGDDDCVLRAGVGCCENCAAGRTGFAALNREADLISLACGDGPASCDDCAPVPPSDVVAECDASGRCTTAYLAID